MVFNSAGIWFCRYSIRFRRYLISQAFNSAGFSMLQVFKSAGIQSCRYLSLKALFLKVFNSAGIRFWRFSCLQVFNSAGIQFCRYSIPQVFDSAGFQICRFSILQVFDPAGIRAWRHQFCRYSFQRSNVCRCTFCQPKWVYCCVTLFTRWGLGVPTMWCYLLLSSILMMMMDTVMFFDPQVEELV